MGELCVSALVLATVEVVDPGKLVEKLEDSSDVLFTLRISGEVLVTCWPLMFVEVGEV